MASWNPSSTTAAGTALNRRSPASVGRDVGLARRHVAQQGAHVFAKHHDGVQAVVAWTRTVNVKSSSPKPRSVSKGEVPGAGHGKKFCEALNEAKEEIGEGLQVSSS